MEDDSKKGKSGVIIAGMNSSDGKTLITCLLLSALERRKILVQPFKIGPDYIDTGYHSKISNRSSLNLDPWIMGKELVIKEAKNFTKNAFGIAEGVMGLFDGSEKTSDAGSSMEISRWLGWQIILVVPCRNAGRSIIAAIQGFVTEAGGEKYFAGIILNKVNSNSHGEYLMQSCASLKIPILGVIPETSKINWPERYLGLEPISERDLIDKTRFADFAEKHINIDCLVKHFSLKSESSSCLNNTERTIPKFNKRIAVSQDEAFHFYYTANFSWLLDKYVEIVKFSPLNDNKVPDNVDGIILGGGFPEVFAEQISSNKGMLSSLNGNINSGIPCYAECGGLMILSEGIKLKSGKFLPLVGVLPGIVKMKKQLQHFGYCKIDLPEYGEIRGHEFHYSSWSDESKKANLWNVIRHSTGESRMEGYRLSNLHASYVHLYFPQASTFIRNFFGLPQK